MKRLRLWALLTLIAMLPTMTACWPSRKRTPVRTLRLPPRRTKAVLQPVEFPPPPEIEAQASAPDIPLTSPEELQGPPPKKRTVSASPRPQTAPPPAEREPAASQAPPPALQPMLDPRYRQGLESAVGSRIASARRVLASIHGRSLNPQQRATVNQIQTFIRQAEQARPTDLIRANNLAERADVLARDLAAGLH